MGRMLVFFMMFSLMTSNMAAYTRTIDQGYGSGYEEVQEKTNECMQEIRDNAKPEVDWVSLRDEEENWLLGTARIRDVYRVEYMSSGVVGLVGPPVRISYDEDLSRLTLTFHYVQEELRGMPERNLIILHEDSDGFYVQVGAETLDTEKKTISVPITEEGIYLLADRYQWYSAWGMDMSEYAYSVDPLAYVSDWERECDTGSIMDIADREWALDNAPYFYVSTPEQLAGVVYYANAINDLGMEELFLYLENDIDLAGYEWVPMGWLGPANIRFDGVVDGKGHTIYNMDIHIPYENHCAFIAYSTGVSVKNITFENASIRGGSYVGIVGGEIYISKEWENVHVSGTISNAGSELGSIIGREAGTHFKNCSADVVYLENDGTTRPIEYFSHRLQVIDNTPVTEDFTLSLASDGTVSRTESDGEFRNLCWHVEVNEVQVLERLAEKETSFNPMEIIPTYIQKGSDCKIWLVAYTGQTYTRVSNIIEYPTE